MFNPALLTSFIAAALPQKVVLIGLAVCIPAIVIGAAHVLMGKDPRGFWRGMVANLRIGGPVVGLFVGGLNSFHMAETITAHPFDPTLKQLAPGIFEVSALVSLGGAVGVAALLAHVGLEFVRPSRRRLLPAPQDDEVRAQQSASC